MTKKEFLNIFLQNKDALIALRTNFDKPDVMKELAKRLVHVDSVLQVNKQNRTEGYMAILTHYKQKQLCLSENLQSGKW